MSLLVGGTPASILLNVHVLRIPFKWDAEGAFSVVRGGSAITRTIEWNQGYPEIENFDIDDIVLKFFSDEELTTEIESGDDDFMIGDEGLDEIITLENFVDNGDTTGSVDVMVDPSGITAMELMAERQVYFALSVNQPT